MKKEYIKPISQIIEIEASGCMMLTFSKTKGEGGSEGPGQIRSRGENNTLENYADDNAANYETDYANAWE